VLIMDNEQWAIDDRQQAIGDKQWGIGNGKKILAIGYGQRVTSSGAMLEWLLPHHASKLPVPFCRN